MIFEVNPRPDQWDAYLGHASMLRPDLERVEGFVDNVRYRSLTRDGWILSLSGWRDEKAVVRWRTRMGHHMVQEKGRGEVLLDYHLRVGQITADTQVPMGHILREQRLDETDIGVGTTVTLVDATLPSEWLSRSNPEEIARRLGLVPHSPGLVAWDVFDAVLMPGDVILMMTWRSETDATASENGIETTDGARRRRVRVVRDYGMFDRREAPQYYPDAPGRTTLHA